MLADQVREALAKNGQNFDVLVKTQMDSHGYNEAQALGEMIANSAPVILQDADFVRRIAETDKNLAQKSPISCVSWLPT